MKSHYKKIGLVCCLIVISGIVTSGCFINDIFTDMMRKPSVVGDWYNNETRTYISLGDDGVFTMGYGKGNTNTGGTYTTDKKEITLHLEYTLSADGIKEEWDPNTNIGEKGKIVLPYKFVNEGKMLIKSEGGNLRYDKISGLNVDITNETLVGKWQYEKGGLVLVFKDDGQYSIVESGDNAKEVNGEYILDNAQLTLKGGEADRVFTCEFVTRDRLLLKNETGEFYYGRNK